MKKLGIFSLVLLLVALVAIAIGGYNILQKPLPNNQMQNQITPTPTPNNSATTPAVPTPGSGGQNLSTVGTTTYSDTDRAKKISDQIMSVGNIKRAPVVVNGNKAIVGVQFIDGTTNGINNVIKNMQLQSSSVINNPNIAGITSGLVPGNPGTSLQIAPNAAPAGSDIRTLISNRVKKADSQITQVFVTTDNGMVDRIQRLVNTTGAEVNDIISKINIGGGTR